MYKKQKISLIFPVYNEEENLAKAIYDFKSLGVIDELIVLDNNSEDKSSLVAKRNGAKVIREKKQGYGYALRRGMKEAKGDLIILSEPDGTFIAKDALKLLNKIKSFDMVLGTRTNKNFINKSANMDYFLRLGNIYLAKLTQVLYKTNNLTDCGCTFRVIKRKVARTLLSNLHVGGSHFLPEMVIKSHLSGFSFIEIPIRYRKRIGTSKITGSKIRSIKVGLRMLVLILVLRVKSFWLSGDFPR